MVEGARRYSKLLAAALLFAAFLLGVPVVTGAFELGLDRHERFWPARVQAQYPDGEWVRPVPSEEFAVEGLEAAALASGTHVCLGQVKASGEIEVVDPVYCKSTKRP